MLFRPTKIAGVWVVEITPQRDDRGFFARVWCQREFAEEGLEMSSVQCSLAYSQQAGTLRGLHFQREPHAERKLVRCIRGAAFVVAVDLRPESTTRREWVGVELSAENRRALFVDRGFAQGYQTLMADTEMLYQMSVPFVPESAAGFAHDDPSFGINWPQAVSVISAKDRDWPRYPS